MTTFSPGDRVAAWRALLPEQRRLVEAILEHEANVAESYRASFARYPGSQEKALGYAKASEASLAALEALRSLAEGGT
jgi:hypothetical protein